MKRVAIFALALVVMVSTLITGTVAYFTDTQQALNVMNAGKVDIVLIEQQRELPNPGTDAPVANAPLEPFEDGKQLFPIVGSAQGDKDNWGMPVAKNFADKIVTVQNKSSSSDAYIRVLVAIPAELLDKNAATSDYSASNDVLHMSFGNRFDAEQKGSYNSASNSAWNWDTSTPDQKITIDGVEHILTTFVYTQRVKPGETTTAAIAGFYLDQRVNWLDSANNGAGMYVMYNSGNSGSYIELPNFTAANGIVKIPVMAQAVQATGFSGYTDAFQSSGFNSTDGLPLNPWLTTTPEDEMDTPDTSEPGTDPDANPPIQAGNADDLRTALNTLVGGTSVILTQDIDLKGEPWSVTAPWNGSETSVVFDGNNYTIKNLTTSGLYGGLFGKFSSNGDITIKNLNLENVNITGTNVDGESAGGALIGWLENHGGGTITIENVTVNGIKAQDFKYIGGLVGYYNGASQLITKNCSVIGTSDSCLNSTYNESENYKGHVGGLAGVYKAGSIENCTVSKLAIKHGTTDMTGSDNRAGALVGTKYEATVTSATIDNVTVDGMAATANTVFGTASTDKTTTNVTIK